MKFVVANLAGKTCTALNNPVKIISLYPSQAEGGGNKCACEFPNWAPLDIHLIQTPCPERPAHRS